MVYPDIDPVALSIGPIAIHWYGLMYLLGFAAAWLLWQRRVAHSNALLTPAQVNDLVFYIALGIILGGRIGYMLFYSADSLVRNPLNLFKVWQGGMSFHGGLLGVILVMMWYARKLGLRFFVLADFVAPGIPAGLFFGRIGNFINGELWGKTVSPDFPLAMIYQGEARHPSMLYEGFFEGIVLFILLVWFSRKARPVGSVSALFLFGYGCARFAIEFIRVPDAHIQYLAWGWLTMGQLLTLPMIAFAIFLWSRAYMPNRREKSA